MGDLKKPPFEKINVNGRVPAIEDPNTGITLWESVAIIEYVFTNRVLKALAENISLTPLSSRYLVDTYDTNNKLSFTSSPEKYLVKQWLELQSSGQGPYFGQAAWFYKFHSEQVESAKQRYTDQITRVFGVLDKALQGKQYLVGDKL